MSKPADDLEAVRQLIDTLTPFENQDRERIIRWAREKLGMTNVAAPTADAGRSGSHAAGADSGGDRPQSGATDIRSFLASKNPTTDTQLIATVAYFFRFIAVKDQQKETIGAADVVEACRQADRKRPGRAAQSMVNAFRAGVIDRVEGGRYKLNTVGENLVAVVLGGDGSAPGSPSSGRPGKSRAKPAQSRRSSKRAKK